MKDKSVLHDHLDGGLRPSTIIELAEQSRIELPTTNPQLLEDWFFENISSELNQVFNKFELTISLMQDEESLERIAVLADQQSSVVKIKLEQKDLALVSADAQDIGSANELVPVSFDFEQFDIAFNVRYLLEGLKVISSQNVIFKCNLPTTPAVLVPEDNIDSFTYLVMPVQVRS